MIRKALNSLIVTDNYLILQYGSSLFGSETKDSDYDIIVVCTLKTLSEATKMSETSRIRESFLFGDLMAKLGQEELLKVYDVKQAKVPILKIKYKETLSLDMSLGIVTNEVLHGVPIGGLSPADKDTESVL